MRALSAGGVAGLGPALAVGLLLILPGGEAQAQRAHPQGRRALAPPVAPRMTPGLPSGSLPSMGPFVVPFVGYRQRLVWAIDEVALLIGGYAQLGIDVPVLDTALWLLIDELIRYDRQRLLLNAWIRWQQQQRRLLAALYWLSQHRQPGFLGGLAGVGWSWGNQLGTRPSVPQGSQLSPTPGGMVGQRPRPPVFETRRPMRRLASSEPGGLVGLGLQVLTGPPAAQSKERGEGTVGNVKAGGAGARGSLAGTGRDEGRTSMLAPVAPDQKPVTRRPLGIAKVGTNLKVRPSRLAFLKGSGRVVPVRPPRLPRIRR